MGKVGNGEVASEKGKDLVGKSRKRGISLKINGEEET